MLRSNDTNELAPASPPAVVMSVCSIAGSIRLRAFWLEPVSIFGSLEFDGGYGSSHMLGISSSLSLRPH